MKQLTAAQQVFATEHHDLIYWFLRRRKLADDEWYGIVAEAYLKAVMDFDPERGAFTTVACRYMENAVRREYHTRGYKKNKGITVSLDDELWNDGLKLEDILAASGNLEEEAIRSADLYQLLQPLDDGQRRLLELWASGLSFREIGKILGITHQGAHQRYTAIMRIIRKFISTGIEEKTMPQWKWSPQRKKIYEQSVAEGKTPEEIAQVVGCSVEVVRKYAADLQRKPSPVVTRKVEQVPTTPKAPEQVPLLHTLVRESQELCRKSWEAEDDEAVYVLGQLQARLDMAVKLLGA